MAAATLDETELQLRAIISNLYMLIVQAHDHQGAGTQQAMTAEIKCLVQNLIALTQTAQRLPTYIPLGIIQHVEASRNPDVYTREFVEVVMRYNQKQKGTSEAFASFRDILGQQMMVGIPEIKEDVKKIIEASAPETAAVHT